MLLSLSQAKFSHCTPLFEDNSYARDEFSSFCFGSDRCRETQELLFFFFLVNTSSFLAFCLGLATQVSHQVLGEVVV